MHFLRTDQRPLFIGVVHLGALPGAPRYGGALAPVLELAAADAAAYAAGGVDALIVENFGDVPFYADSVPPETVAAMALALARVGEAAPGVPLGVNVLRNDARSALGLAAATGAAFIRVNVHTGTMATDQGLLQGRAAETLRVRRSLAPAVAILADVHVKHAVPLAGERLIDAAHDAFDRGLADGLVLSGRATGAPPDAALVHEVRAALGPRVPLLLGSGVDHANAAALLAAADGAIVGTALKTGGVLAAPVDPARVRALRETLSTVPGTFLPQYGARHVPPNSL